MTPRRVIAGRGSAQFDLTSIVLAGVLLLVGLMGLTHLRYAEWRPAPGGGPWLVPLLAYLVIIPAALVVLYAAVTAGPGRGDDQRPAIVPVMATALWSVAFFYAVRHLGLVSGTWLSVGVAMIVLSPRPLEAPKIVIPITIAVGLVFWLMFTRVAPIIIQRSLLF